MFRILFQTLFIVVAALCVVSDAWFFKSKGTGWNKLSVTWGKFSSLPTEASDAQRKGWQKTGSCDVNSYYRGNRYVYGDDKSVMLLFDSAGKIAGIQFGIKKCIAQNPGYNKSHWIADGDSLVITAYFVNPSLICNGGRTKSDDIGENLYIQLDRSTTDLMSVPLKEKELSSTKWVKGKCFWTMGQHYWYDISQNMKCEDFFPVFLLYNRGKLNGFGWAMQGNVKSPRVEHPTPNRFHYFFDPKTLPVCLSHQGILTTQHIYLQSRPYFNFC